MLSTCTKVRVGGLAATVAVAMPATAQTIAIPERPTCSTCQIELSEVAHIGAEGSGVFGGTPLALARLPDGRIIAAFNEYAHQIEVYEQGGIQIRAVGRRGRGPGEFEFIQGMVAIADGVHVYDTNLHRRTILSVSNLSPLRTDIANAPVRRFRGMAFFPDGRFVLNGMSSTEEGAGFPLHEFDADGTLARSFGRENRTYDSTTRPQMYQVLAASGDGSLWAADVVRYRIERWNRTGERMLAFEGQRSWFQPEGQVSFVSRTHPPPPNIISIVEDAAGLLWLLASVPDPRWRDALGEGPREGREPGVSVSDWVRFTDTIVEVIDPVAGRVVATQRFDWPLAFIDSSHVAAFNATRTGEPYLKVWRIELVRR